MKCPKCGKEFTEGSNFCEYCGERVTDYIVAKSEYDKLKSKLSSINRSGYAPSGSRIIKDEEYYAIKNNNKRIFTYGIYGLIGLCIILLLYWSINDIFGKEPKTGIEIVKDEATGKYGIYNHDKDFLATPYEFDSIQHRTWVDQENYNRNYCVLFNNLLGIADSTGVIQIPCELNEIEGAYSGLIISRQNGYEGLFDTYGYTIFKPNNYRVLWEKTPQLNTLTPGTYIGNIIPVKRNQNSGWELFDRTGRKIINTTFPEAIQTGSPDLIKVKYHRYYGLVNGKGEVVVEYKATWITRFHEGIAFVYISEPYNIYAIDELGNKLFSPSLPSSWRIWLVCEGLFAVKDKKNEKIGYYDIKGKLVIPHKFEQVKEGNNLIDPSFSGDSARVSYNGQNGYVFKDGSFRQTN